MSRLFTIPVNYVIFHNLFLLRHCYPAKKIAINYFTPNELMVSEKRITAADKLDSKIMSYEGWEVLNITHDESREMLIADRDKFYRDWLSSAKDKQIKKGVIVEIPKAL